MKVGVLDYKAGNLRSVETALEHLGIDYVTADKPAKLVDIDRLIFPGVGEAFSAMEILRERGFDELLREFPGPVLGICLGCQILFDRSEERDTKCLGIIPGEVRRFSQKSGLKIPHMGWNQVRHGDRHPIFNGIPDGASFYFVHSYYVAPSSQENVISETNYDGDFASGVISKNIIAFQFHPEKSGPYGLKLLENFFALKEL